MTRAEIFDAICIERARQETKWAAPHRWGSGSCASDAVAPIVKVAVLAEECGEVARAVLDDNRYALRQELVQVASVAVAWLEAL